MASESFDTDRYYECQMQAFSDRFSKGDTQIIEFGGKPFGDYHAERVLPGYDPDIKGYILQDIVHELGDTCIAMSLHAQDVLSKPDGRRLNKRIRGDTGLHYDDEVIRLVSEARERFELPLDTVVISALSKNLSESNHEFLENYKARLDLEGIAVKNIDYIKNYPFIDVNNIVPSLTKNQNIAGTDNLIVLSPGGGSGKFGVAITEIAHQLELGKNPNFVKFETFPVFKLPIDHSLNLAFLAATADLPNELIVTDSGQTNYDKDLQNFTLLRSLISHFPDLESPLKDFIEPTDMGVNQIEKGIICMKSVESACSKEIARRLIRYKNENSRGYEDITTIERTQNYLEDLDPPETIRGNE